MGKLYSFFDVRTGLPAKCQCPGSLFPLPQKNQSRAKRGKVQCILDASLGFCIRQGFQTNVDERIGQIFRNQVPAEKQTI